jgi:hypothetical protein
MKQEPRLVAVVVVIVVVIAVVICCHRVNLGLLCSGRIAKNHLLEKMVFMLLLLVHEQVAGL